MTKPPPTKVLQGLAGDPLFLGRLLSKIRTCRLDPQHLQTLVAHMSVLFRKLTKGF